MMARMLGTSVCVVDDDFSSREALVSLVRSAGLHAESFESAVDFLACSPRPKPRCLILDIDMPELSGLALQRKLAEDAFDVPIIFVTGHGDIRMSVQAIKAGALEFFTKPFDADALLAAVNAAIARSVVTARSVAPRSANDATGPGLGMIGASARIRAMISDIESVARTDSTVLVQGETGTGKELVARAIHEASARRDGPFVKVNCAAIPAGLLESELMGHEKGAFTGALMRRIGRFEQANNGTIFLDEIGEMAIELQPKLLRLLQEREFERLGSPATVRVNVRVVAATNRDLRRMADERTFREDLFYRLSVFPVRVPPLRERRDDVRLLVDHFVRHYAARMQKDARIVSAATLERLVRYDWPGNVRELQNVIERAVILAAGPVIEIDDLPRGTTSSLAPPPSSEYGEELADVTRAHIVRVLESVNWVVAGANGAAARLGMKRSTLLFRMQKLGIERPTSRGTTRDVP